MQRMKKNPTAEKQAESAAPRLRPGDSIIMTKWIALEGSSILAKEREKELLTYFSPYFVESAKSFDRFLSTDTERETAEMNGGRILREVREGGIYGALWDMAEEADVGIDVFLHDIPVKQETIEIANFFNLDPYLLLSGGALLMTADNEYALVRRLEEKGVNAAVIGYATDSNDRVIINNGSRRFLSPRYKDEIKRSR